VHGSGLQAAAAAHDPDERELRPRRLSGRSDDSDENLVDARSGEERPDAGRDRLEGSRLLFESGRVELYSHARIIAPRRLGRLLPRGAELPTAGRAGRISRMPAPAPRRTRLRAVPYPPTPLERGLIRERAKRRARVEHEREKKRARRRFQVLLLGLLFLTIVLGLTIWDQIQALFGL
jgi:hypothetical protein